MKERSQKVLTFGLEKERDYFVENLSMLIEGGVSITEAIDSIKEGVPSERMKSILDQIKEDVDAGLPIWKSFVKTNLFPSHIVSLIRLGEESGTLNRSMKTAVEQQEKNRLFRGKIYSAMMYPVFVLSLTGIVGFGIAWFILPRLAVTFSQMDVELPLVTKVLIAIGNFLGENGYYFIPVLILSLFVTIFFLFFHKKTKHIGQALLFAFPISGRLIREVEVSRFGYLLGTLLDSGLSVKKALLSLRQATNILPYSNFYKHLGERVEEGDSFKKSFLSYEDMGSIIPLPVQQLVFAGEKSGSLSKTLLKIGKKFEEKAENTTKNLTIILEPVMLVIVGGGVALVAIAVILPMYSLVGGLGETRTTSPSPRLQAISEEQIVEEKIQALPLEGDYLMVYSGPSFDSDIIAEIKSGEKMTYLEEEGGWYKIFLSEEDSAWVFEEYVEVLE